jgi:uncharacterized OB-fold protein
MILCKHCGSWNLEPARFCTRCGRRIANKKFNWLLLITCGVLLAILVTALLKGLL